MEHFVGDLLSDLPFLQTRTTYKAETTEIDTFHLAGQPFKDQFQLGMYDETNTAHSICAVVVEFKAEFTMEGILEFLNTIQRKHNVQCGVAGVSGSHLSVVLVLDTESMNVNTNWLQPMDDALATHPINACCVGLIDGAYLRQRLMSSSAQMVTLIKSGRKVHSMLSCATSETVIGILLHPRHVYIIYYTKYTLVYAHT